MSQNGEGSQFLQLEPDPAKAEEHIRGLVERMLKAKPVTCIIFAASASGSLTVGYLGTTSTLIPLYEKGGDALAAMMREAARNQNLNG